MNFGIVVGEVRANLNDHYHYPVQFSRLICRRRKRNKLGVMQLVFVIGVANFYLEQALRSLKKFESPGVVFGEAGANLNDQYIYPVQFCRLICRGCKKEDGCTVSGLCNSSYKFLFVVSIIVSKTI